MSRIVWNTAKTIGIILNFEDELDNGALAYELRKGASNPLGLIDGIFMEAWNEFTCEDACTIENLEKCSPCCVNSNGAKS